MVTGNAIILALLSIINRNNYSKLITKECYRISVAMRTWDKTTHERVSMSCYVVICILQNDCEINDKLHNEV